jgi:dihydrofolate reductase
MNNISLIVACDENWGIGKNNALPWHLSVDLKRFKQLTSGNIVMMGRKTWESLPVKPLANRDNVVLSSDLDFNPDGVEVIRTSHKALNLAQLAAETNQSFFVIGGSTVYEQFFPLADKLFLTRLKGSFNCDTFFPGFDESKWLLKSREDGVEKDIAYSFEVYERKYLASIYKDEENRQNED